MAKTPIHFINLNESRSSATWGDIGENNAVWLSYDVSAMQKAWPNGGPGVSFRRGDGIQYAHEWILEGSMLYVPILSADTEVAGVVTAVIVWQDGDDIAKSQQFSGRIIESISTAGSPPSAPEQGVIEQMQSIMSSAASSAARAEASAAAANASVDAVASAGAEQIAAIGKKGDDVLASIPDDYTALTENVQQLSDALSTKAPVIVDTMTGTVCTTDTAADMPLHGLRLYGKTTQDGTPTPDAPVPLVSVGDAGEISVTALKKNWFSAATAVSVGVDGVETPLDVARSTPYIPVKPGDIMAFSKTIPLTDTSANGMLRCFDAEKKIVRSITALAYDSMSNVVTIPEGVRYVRFCQFGFTQAEGQLIQVEFAAAPTSYDGTAATILPLSTPGGLPGIPVTSGGNYTDENGQQWICDEIDLKHGVKRTRLVCKTLTSALEWSLSNDGSWYFTIDNNFVKERSHAALCSHAVRGTWGSSEPGTFSVGNGTQSTIAFCAQDFESMDAFKAWLDAEEVVVIGLLKTPTETALTADEVAAYKTLHTSKPIATVYNDAGAGMQVDYAADTKLYIDKKISVLAAAALNN